MFQWWSNWHKVMWKSMVGSNNNRYFNILFIMYDCIFMLLYKFCLSFFSYIYFSIIFHKNICKKLLNHTHSTTHQMKTKRQKIYISIYCSIIHIWRQQRIIRQCRLIGLETWEIWRKVWRRNFFDLKLRRNCVWMYWRSDDFPYNYDLIVYFEIPN